MNAILIIDDEDLMRYSLSTIFKNEDTVVTTAADGASAVHAISAGSFDLCFLDIHLPDMNGLDIMKQLRDVSPRTRIVIMTGSDVSDAMMKAIRENAHALISKPFDLTQVKLLVCRILKKDKPLPLDESAAIKDQMSFITWLADDIRKHIRKPITDSITCYAVAPQGDSHAVRLTANILDITETGMCILTDYELKPGHLLRLSDSSAQRSAVVRWSEFSGITETYRAGIQFVAPESPPV